MTATQTTKQPASDSVVIKAINDEPGLRKEWRNLSESQKRRVLESAKGCTDAVCLMNAMSEVSSIEKEYELFEGDCLERMASIEDSSVDCVITDPPYCSGAVGEASRSGAAGQGLRSGNLKKFGWFVGDNMTTGGLIWLLRSIAVESLRVTKPSGSVLIFCDWRMIHNLVPAIESVGLRYQGLIVWNKGHFGMGTGFRCQHEMIMHFTCGKPEYYDRSTGNVIESSRINAINRQHQTQKPTDLMKALIQVVSPPRGLVLDPFCGSGSTGVAALEIGRRFVGIDRSPAYLEIAEKRLSGFQKGLFHGQG